ncbi:MAG TPA: YciI family protein [Trebonia sp.]|nr:YciI family protein [Trebonia sp.]
MAQYLLALYYDDRKFSAQEFRRLCVDVPALDAKMQDAGVFVFHGGTLGPESATVVRPSGSDFVITDGPYAETKEHLGGFWIIDVPDLDVALEWAKLATVACRRPVEIVPFEMRTIDQLLAASAAGSV